MATRAAKDALYEALATTAKALGNGRRAQLVDVLAQGERPVDELADQIGQSTANTSQHLQFLLRAGLVRTRRDGTRIFYSLASPQVAQLWALVRDVSAEHVGELERLATAYLGDRSRLQTMTRAELTARLHDGDVIVLDVRPDVEFASGHVAGAVSVPISELTTRLRRIPRQKQVVAYCRGPYCVYADDAVRTLRRRGYEALRLEDGYPEWAREGLPTATGAPDSSRRNRSQRAGCPE